MDGMGWDGAINNQAHIHPTMVTIRMKHHHQVDGA